VTVEAVLELIDQAPAFAEPQPLSAEDLRKAGLAALDVESARLRSAEGDARAIVLQEAAYAAGTIAGAGAIEEPLAKALLEAAALEAGLIKDIGAKAVKSTIAAAMKAGKKVPRDFSTDIMSQLRPGEAGNSAAVHVFPSPTGEGGSAEPSTASSSVPAAPAPPLEGEKSSAQTLAQMNGKSDDRDRAMKDCADLDHSDTDNGKRLIKYFGDDLLVRRESGTAVGTWLGWAGTHWDIDNGSALAAIFAQLVGDIIMEETRFIEPTKSERVAIEDGKVARSALKAITEPEKADAAEMFELKRRVIEGDTARGSLSKRRSARRKHGLATKNRARMSAMLDCAGPHLRRSPDDFNADPLLVATSTHTLRFMQEADLECPDPDVTRLKWICEALSEHRRSDLLTGVVPVKYVKGADCPRWRANMKRFQPNEAQRRTVQQFAGVGLLGKPIQRVMFHYGTGGNFKSVFLETITRVLGDSFAIGLPTESLVGGADGSPGGARPDLERVFGKRMLRIAELPAGVNLKADLIKKLTGGEKWPVRTLYKGFFEFVPLAKTHMSGNDAPQFDGSDGGMRRRLLYIEWPVKIPEAEQRDFDIVVGELLEEAPGILNWLIDGAIDYLENGLTVSDETRANTEDYFDEMDPTAMFIRDCVSDAPGESVGARVMYQAYKSHCDANARRPIFETKFGRIMKKKFKRDDKRTHRYLDVALHDVPESRSADSAGDPRDSAPIVNRDREF
jgi:putative DNA primase/helicase